MLHFCALLFKHNLLTMQSLLRFFLSDKSLPGGGESASQWGQPGGVLHDNDDADVTP